MLDRRDGSVAVLLDDDVAVVLLDDALAFPGDVLPLYQEAGGEATHACIVGG